MLVETGSKHRYYRPSPDGTRIVIGGRAALHPIHLEIAARWLMRELRAIFPSLGDAQVSHAWTGNVAMTRSDLPGIGQRDGIWYALGCNGSGVAMMPHLGRKLALKVMRSARRPHGVRRHTVYRRPLLQWQRVVPAADDVVVSRGGHAARQLIACARVPR